MAERSKKKKEETLTLKLGNLPPGQEATLRLQIINQMKITGGHYTLALPMAFYPDYTKHGVLQEDFVYDFSYKVNITAQGPITSLSMPEMAEVTYKNETKTYITIECPEPCRSMDLYYRTGDMLLPQLSYAETPDGNQVACSVSLVPTFDPVAP